MVHPSKFVVYLAAGVAGLAALGVCPFHGGDKRAHARENTPAAGAAHAALQHYGELPLSFEANAGQADSRVQFLSRGHGYTLLLAGDEALLALKKSRASGTLAPAPVDGQLVATERHPGSMNAAPLLDMRLAGANPHARAEGINALQGKSNYLIGNDPSRWKVDIANYAAVRYDRIYPGINLFYYGNQGHLEYDFTVAPGSNVDSIGWSFKTRGAQPDAESDAVRRIDFNGDLVLAVDGTEMRFSRPVAYQLPRGVPDSVVMFKLGRTFSAESGQRTLIGSRWVMRGGQVGFETGPYDHSRPLVIDPTLAYATFLGGSSEDHGNAIAVDSSGNVYIAGATVSEDFPKAGKGFQTDCKDCAAIEPNAFVTKLNADGSAFIYSTYLGGTGYGTRYFGDQASGIVVDGQGNAFVTGATDSADFPFTQGAFRTTCPACSAGSTNAFVTKLNATGSGLVYSTYLGGTGNVGNVGDWANAIAVDTNGDAYVTGSTFSPDFPISTGALQTSCHDCKTGTAVSFITELKPDGSGYLYSTFLGGSNQYGEGGSGDVANAIAVDDSGNAYIAGQAMTRDFPATPGAFQQNLKQAGSGGFVAKVNSSGTALLYATLLAGSANGSIQAIAIDGSGNAYVAGNTTSGDFPFTTGTYQTTCAGSCDDAFVTKLNPQGSGLVFSTFLGGTDMDMALGIVIDSNGISYITGETKSSDFPHTSDAAQTLCDRSSARCHGDAFLTELNASGTGLVYSTFLGGGAEDAGSAIALDGSKNVYLTGSTLSVDFPVTAGAAQKNCGANCTQLSASDPIPWDAFVAKFGTAASSGAPSLLVSPASLTFGNQAVDNASSPQVVALTNTGNATLTSLAISITGTNSGDFTQTNTCGASLAAGAACAANVTFNPGAAGSRTASVKIIDSAGSSPQAVGLSGTGTSALGLGIASGSSSSATVSSGSTASYTLTIGGAGFGGTVALTCSGAPQKSTCSIPSSVAVSAAQASTIPVSVTTTAGSLAELHSPVGAPMILSTSALALLFFPRRIRRKALLRILGVLALAAAAFSMSACGAPGSIIGKGQGTPAGAYTLTVNATSGSLNESTQLKLTVQ